MSSTGRYLYAVTRGLEPDRVDGVTGLDGHPVELVEHDGLTAVVSAVDLQEYGEEGLRANLERLDWLERTVRAHDAVVKAVNAHRPTAPIRLATVFFDDDAVRSRLREWRFALEQVLDRIEGRMEWSVKTFVMEPADRPAPVPAPVGSGGGAAYLRAKKQAAQGRHDVEAAALATAEEVHETLSTLSVASRRLRPQDPRLTGYDGTMVLNGAYLVDRVETEAFAQAVDRLSEAHPEARVLCGGPWPPYSFAMLDQR